MTHKTVTIKDVRFSMDSPVSFILGPCQIESRDHSMFMAEALCRMADQIGAQFVFKSSFDKANRSSVTSQRGVGQETGLRILQDVRAEFGCPVITDVHAVDQITPTAEVVDALQIPAFLCRQTDLLLAAGASGKPVHIKKGQFLAPQDMEHVARKVASTGNDQILLCERGTSFGYNTLVNDFRGLEIMAQTGYPVIFDATHSVQSPGGLGASSGGDRRFVPALARAACAIGVAGVFIETHNNPDTAPCDGPNMIALEALKPLLTTLIEFDALAKKG